MEILLFILRLAVLGALYGFLAAVLWLIWREFQWLSTSTASGAGGVVPPVAVGLRVLEGGETGLTVGEVLTLERSATMGRGSGSGIVLADTSVSARHAILTFESGCWWIQDLSSTNGTYLNGNPVHRKLALRTNDVLALGQVRLRLEEDAISDAISYGGTQ